MENKSVFRITHINYKSVVMAAGVLGAFSHIQAAFDLLALNRNYVEFLLLRVIAIASWCLTVTIFLLLANFILRIVGGAGIEYQIATKNRRALRITYIKFTGIAIIFALYGLMMSLPFDFLAQDPRTWGRLIPLDLLAQDPPNWGGLILYPFLMFVIYFLGMCVLLFIINSILAFTGGIAFTFENEELPSTFALQQPKKKITPPVLKGESLQTD